MPLTRGLAPGTTIEQHKQHPTDHHDHREPAVHDSTDLTKAALRDKRPAGEPPLIGDHSHNQANADTGGGNRRPKAEMGHDRSPLCCTGLTDG